jgi:peptide/nickel transport system permease protein
MVTAEIVIIILSLLLSIVSAVRQYSFLDNLISSFSFIGFSMPIFFIALGSMQIFAVQFKAWGLPYLPTGADIWDPKDPVAMARHLVLPVSCLVIIQTAGYSRFLRSSILEVLGLDYVRTARAKGLTERVTLFKHALRNAILPFVTIVGLDIPFLLGGALVTESIFAWPGMGRLFWEYAERGDYPVVNGVLLLTSTAVVFFTIVVDMLYTVVDPRIRLE